jgi:hypothetical protein
MHLLKNVVRAKEVRLFSIGHSLSAEIPDMVAYLARSGNDKFSFAQQFRLGASLHYQWDEPKHEKNKYDDGKVNTAYHLALPKGGYTHVTLIDSVPRGGKEQEMESVEYLTQFVRYIRKTNPHAIISYVEPWHSLLSGSGKAPYDTASPTRGLSWRKRVDADRPMWERIVATAEKNSGATIYMIPQATAFARLADAVESGRFQTFKKTADLFDDDIHAKPPSMYFIACLHYALYYAKSPVGLPGKPTNRWGGEYFGVKWWNGKTYPQPPATDIKQMQEIAWSVAQNTLRKRSR